MGRISAGFTLTATPRSDFGSSTFMSSSIIISSVLVRVKRALAVLVLLEMPSEIPRLTEATP